MSSINNSKVSIAIPTYNRRDFLRQAIQSALNQTFTDITILVVDNASTDGSLEEISDLQGDSRLHIIRNEINIGPVENFRKAINLSNSEYIKLLCSDDYLHPDCIHQMVKILDEHHDVGIVTSPRIIVDNSGKQLDVARYFSHDVLITGNEAIELFLLEQKNFIGEPTAVMFRRNLYQSYGILFEKQYSGASDLVTWLDILQGAALYYIGTPLCYFRQHTGMWSKESGVVLEWLLEYADILQDCLSHGYLQESSLREKAISLNISSLKQQLADNHLLKERPKIAKRITDRIQSWVQNFNKYINESCCKTFETKTRQKQVDKDNFLSMDNHNEKNFMIDLKRKKELSFWHEEIVNYLDWYRGNKSLWEIAPPTEEAKEKRYDETTNACITWTKMTRHNFLKKLSIPNSDYFKDKRILEVGCGPTNYSSSLTGCIRVCLDPLVREYSSAGFPLYLNDAIYINSPAEDMPFIDNYFDAILSMNSIDHLDDFEAAAKEIGRVVRADGELFIEAHYHKPIDEAHPYELNDDKFIKAFSPYFELSKIGTSAASSPEGSLFTVWHGIKRKTTKPHIKQYLNNNIRNMPLVSVIIPCYNQAQFLPDAVASVVNQTFADWECIIVNDGSPDNTREVAEQLIDRYKGKRIRLINQQNQGLAQSRNNGIAASGGKYILPLDSDDKLHPEFLQKTTALLNADLDIAIAYTDTIRFGNINNTYQTGNFDLCRLSSGNILNYCSLYRREAWEAVGGYNTNMTWGYEDWDFWIACGEKGFKGRRIPEYLFMYRIKENSMLTKAAEHDSELKAQIVMNHPNLYDGKIKEWAKTIMKPKSSKENQDNKRKKLKKVLLVVHNFPPLWNAGVEIYTFSFSQELIKKGVSVSVFYPKVDPSVESLRVEKDVYHCTEIFRLIVGGKLEFQQQIENRQIEDIFKNILKEGGFDLVHFHHTHQHLPFSLINTAKDMSLPVCITLHDFWFVCCRTHLYIPERNTLCDGPTTVDKCVNCVLVYENREYTPSDKANLYFIMAYRHEQARQALQRADIVVSPTKFLADRYSSYSFGQGKIAVSPLGLDPVHVVSAKKNRKGIIFGCLGAFHALKNTDFLAEAFKTTKGDARLLFWGNGNHVTINKLIKAGEEDKRISYMGSYSQDQLSEILSRVDIVVVPSLIENYPLVVREALSGGIPVIASRAGGIPEIITNGENGILFDPHNKVELTNIIQSIIDNPSLIGQLHVDREKIKRMDQDVDEWTARYEELLNSTKEAKLSDIEAIYCDIQGLIKAEKYSDAINTLEDLLQENPSLPFAHNDLGVLYFNRGDRERALNHYEKAAQLNPDNITFQKNLADFYFVVMDRTDDALKIYLKVLDKYPKDVETLYALGQICTALDRIDDARFLFGRVLETEPDNINARQSLDAFQSKPVETTRRVSIIIPVFNKVEFTRKCIDAIRKNTPSDSYELIIVDNASSDGTGEFLKGLSGNIKVIANEKNLGFARACNQGARAANTDYILFLNNDTEPQQGWLPPLLEVIENDPTIGAVGSKLLFPDGTIQHSGVVIIDDRKLPDPLVARHIYYQSPSDFFDANRLMTYQALTAACLIVRKDEFNQIHGFDEGYWNGYEDIDFCFKLQEKGLKLVYQPESVLIHHESKSGPERFTKVQHNIERLHNKWLNKIRPDLIIEKNGSIIQTEAQFIRPYIIDQTQSLKSGQLHVPYRENLVSIVILTFNQLKYTQECVESIRKHTPEPHEVIFVDNGSTDGTVKWLKQLVKRNPNYKLIENKKNLGFAKGCNQGISAASGEYLMLLNNDVVVTDSWLSGMLECLNSSLDVGIVGPMTNNISGPQKVENVGYPNATPHLSPLPMRGEEMSGLDLYAKSFKERNRHRRIPMRRIVGFCMLFKRDLLDKIGLLDECFGTGNFEDDDYCLRAALEGYRNMIAGDVFIYHYGSISFIGNRIDYDSAMGKNKDIFSKKWSGIDTNSSVGKNLMALKAMEKADELNQTGQLDKAVEHILQEGIRYCPDDRRLYFAIADILIDAKQFKDALDTINEMPGGDEDIKKLVIAGYCKQGMGLDDEAEQYADRALSLDPHSSLALNLKGIIAHKKGKLDAAEAFFKKSIESDNGYGEPYTNLGLIRWDAGEKNDGLDLLEKGVILSPKVTDSINLYHSAVTETGEFERAEKLFRELKPFYPMSKTMSFLLIDSLIKQGKNSAAMQEIENAMVAFGVDDGILGAALEIRNNLGPHETSAYAGGRNSVSLCMIVKNEERHIAKCLMSLKPIVDETIIVDTGSSDRTKGITTAFGAKVYDFPWTGSFSDARNFSLSKASCQWIFVMDADEVISTLDYPAFNDLVKKAKQGASAFKFITRNYITSVNINTWNPNDGRYVLEEAGAGWVPSDKVRLFPNNMEIRFENPVHEMVEPSLKRLKIPVREVSIPVHHYGKLSAETSREKGEQYYLLGKKKLDETGGNLDAICELAIQAGELEKYDEALELWQKAIKINPDLPVAFMNIGYIYLQKWMYAESLTASKKAMELKPDFWEAISNYSVANLCGGDIKTAISTLEGMLKKNPKYLMAVGILSAAYCCDGQRQKGLECFARLNQEQVAFSGLLSSLARQLIAARRVGYATLLLEAAVESNNINADIPGLLTDCYLRAGSSHNTTAAT